MTTVWVSGRARGYKDAARIRVATAATAQGNRAYRGDGAGVLRAGCIEVLISTTNKDAC